MHRILRPRFFSSLSSSEPSFLIPTRRPREQPPPPPIQQSNAVVDPPPPASEDEPSISVAKSDGNDRPPSLLDPSPLDARDILEFPPGPNFLGGRVIVRNHISIFDDLPSPIPTSSSSSSSSPSPPESSTATRASLHLSPSEIKSLYSTILLSRTVKQQTPKGKIARKQFLVCVGNGHGLVGYGSSTDSDSRLALTKARTKAIQNMDFVSRYEERTIWTELSTKLGATRIIMRPRPVGFGLRCNPFIHQILRATGFKDVSAKVWGSRNKLNVVKAVFRMLQAGHAPTGMGDGVGGKGIKLSKGVGMRGKEELERARGRKLIGLRK